MNHQERLAVLNDTERSVLDSIDRPIRGLIIQMNAHGIRTVFSCCGFNYDGEEEPKTHSTAGPFVVLQGPGPNSRLEEYVVFHAFAFDAHACGWDLTPYHLENNKWVIRYSLKPEQAKFYQQRDGIQSIHDYELPLIAIKRLEKTLARHPVIVKEYSIVDGNTGYAEALDNEWQIKPKKPFVFKENETAIAS